MKLIVLIAFLVYRTEYDDGGGGDNGDVDSNDGNGGDGDDANGGDDDSDNGVDGCTDDKLNTYHTEAT